MTNLKKNIDHYMQQKGIKMYSHLLVDIAHQLGIKGQESYAFAEREKSNFSKMLKGERPLKYEFIIPLEKIFGVSLARLLEEDAYKLPIEKDNVPFNKGFRYYAYLDDPKLYKEEFDLLLAKDGKPIISQTDEFGKTFLDYVVEYGAVNGVRYLYDTYEIKLRWYYNHFEFKENMGVTWVDFGNCIEFARLVASMDDADLFYGIYDSYNMFFESGYYGGKDSIFNNTDFFEIILDNDNLFNSMFEIKPYKRELGPIGQRKRGVTSITHYSINPIINNCLRHALKHLDKYRSRVEDILKFGITHNARITDSITVNEYWICNELGGVKKIAGEEKDCCDIAIFVDIDIDDSEIKDLVARLPKFQKYDDLFR